MTERNRIAAQLAAARPRSLAALTRYFRDLDVAEDAYQEACLRALRRWPEKGLPQDPTAWLILVARNAGIDMERRSRGRLTGPLDEALLDDPSDPEALYAAAIDQAHLRDDVLRLLFMCCHPELQVQDQLALALKVVVGFRSRKSPGPSSSAPRPWSKGSRGPRKRPASSPPSWRHLHRRSERSG